MPTLFATRYPLIGWLFIGPSNQPVTPCTSALNSTSETAVATMFTAENRATSPVILLRRLPMRASVSQRGTRLERLPPGSVVPIPGNGLGETLFERHLWTVSQLVGDLGDVDGV